VGGQPLRELASAVTCGAPSISDEESASVIQCLQSRWIGNGPKVLEFERAFAAYKGANAALAVNSGTAALHLALEVLGVGDGDEVLVPTMTFCATAQAVDLAGAKPVFVDCDAHSFNCRPVDYERVLTPKTRAIMVVHIAGRCVDMQPVLELARQHDLFVIEDCAHALESSYQSTASGMMGDAGCFSFYATKSVTTGDGGMLLMRNEEHLDRARVLANHGMTANAWDRLNSARSGYQVVSGGYKYNMTDMEASLGVVQLASVEDRWRRRAHIWNMYHSLLGELPVQLPKLPSKENQMAYHLFSLVIDEDAGISVDTLAQALMYEGVGTGVHYVPLHMQPYFKSRYDLRKEDFPNASSIGSRLISLPLNIELTDVQVMQICSALRRIFSFYDLAAIPYTDAIPEYENNVI